jgi:hypothetical protein
MEELEKYQLINKCETDNELADAIIAISNPETNMILGRTKVFDAMKMAENCHLVIKRDFPPNLLTREFGIRQQALYIKYYNGLFKIN